MEIVGKRQHYLNLFYVVVGLLLGIIGNMWVYYFSKWLETSFGLSSSDWLIIFSISSVLLVFLLYFSVRHILRGLKERMPRLLKYSRIVKNVHITDEDGNAQITWVYQGKNLSKISISQIRHILRYPTQPLKEDEIGVYLDGEKMKSRLETSKIHKNSHEALFESQLCLDLANPIKSGQKFGYKIGIPYKKAYSAAFAEGGDFTYYRAHGPTDEIVIKIFPPQGYTVELFAPEGGPRCTAKDWYMILDLAETKRVNDDEPARKEGNRLIWEINKPFVDYEYRINFKITKSA